MFISFIQCTGEWGEDDFCDPGEYAIGFQVHSYKDKDNCEYAHSHKENNEYMLLAFRHAFSS